MYLLRLMFLHDRVTDFGKLNIVRELLRRLLTNQNELADANSIDAGFGSVAAHTMALCAISNLIAHPNGAAVMLDEVKSDQQETSQSLELVNDLVTVAVNGITHKEANIRQISSALAYNIALACAQNNRWLNVTASGDPVLELPWNALQILCACLDGISQESDDASRHRRLAASCIIARFFSKAVPNLINELGYVDFLQILESDPAIKPAVTEDEKSMIRELLQQSSRVHS